MDSEKSEKHTVSTKIRRSRRPGTAPDVIAEIHRLSLSGVGPTAIGERLEAYLAERNRSREMPHANTVEKYARQVRSDSGPIWSWATGESPIAGRLMRITALVRETTAGRDRGVTVRQAETIARIVGAFPDIPDREAWELARQWDERGAIAIEGYLGFEPWRDGGRRYYEAVSAGAVDTIIVTTASSLGFDEWRHRELARVDSADRDENRGQV